MSSGGFDAAFGLRHQAHRQGRRTLGGLGCGIDDVHLPAALRQRIGSASAAQACTDDDDALAKKGRCLLHNEELLRQVLRPKLLIFP